MRGDISCDKKTQARQLADLRSSYQQPCVTSRAKHVSLVSFSETEWNAPRDRFLGLRCWWDGKDRRGAMPVFRDIASDCVGVVEH